MKKVITAFIAGVSVAALPYLVLSQAHAQAAGPTAQGGQGGQRGAGGQGGFPGRPGQPGQGAFGGAGGAGGGFGGGQGGAGGGFGGGQQPGMGMQQAPPVTSITSDNDHIYASAGNIVYKINKTSMRIEGQVALMPQQRAQRPPLGNGGEK